MFVRSDTIPAISENEVRAISLSEGIVSAFDVSTITRSRSSDSQDVLKNLKRVLPYAS